MIRLFVGLAKAGALAGIGLGILGLARLRLEDAVDRYLEGDW